MLRNTLLHVCSAEHIADNTRLAAKCAERIADKKIAWGVFSTQVLHCMTRILA